MAYMEVGRQCKHGLFCLISACGLHTPEMDFSPSPLSGGEFRCSQVPHPPLIVTDASDEHRLAWSSAFPSDLGLHAGFNVLVICTFAGPPGPDSLGQDFLQEADVAATSARRAGECQRRRCRVSSATVSGIGAWTAGEPADAASHSKEFPGMECGASRAFRCGFAVERGT
jgi:hypothetical protein